MEMSRIHMQFNPLPTRLKCNTLLPVYNWLYPFESNGTSMEKPLEVFEQMNPSSQRRALYFHIPFCDTICSFCPFMRGEFEHQNELDIFVQALLQEIEFKHRYEAINSVPVDCIYFGGGTPSVLSTEHFYQIGEALHRYFDLSQLQEFTIECEVKSVTQQKLKAWQDIGVTRVSFGVQTFHPLYRELFTMTATVDQIRQVAAWVNERFPFTNVDMIYGMAGQTLDDLLEDADKVNELGMTTVDFFILNNTVSQPRLHRSFEEHGLKPLSANTKLSYRMFLNEYMRAQGYVPNDSYSFTKSKAPLGSPRIVMQYDPVFLYQSITYGFADDYVLGFGPGSISHLGAHVIYNLGNRDQYAKHLLKKDGQPWFKASGGRNVADKGIVYFPYRGSLEKSRIQWDAIRPETIAVLNESVEVGLAIDRGDTYELTEAGWLLANSYMYALMSPGDQEVLTKIVNRSANQGRKADHITVLRPSSPIVPVVPAPSP